MKEALAKILPFQVNAAGELQEWSQDFTQQDSHHRHASHLLTVWPLNQITERATPQLFAAAKLSLDHREGGAYHPDKAAMWARLKIGDKALSSLGTVVADKWSVLYSGLPEMLLFSHNLNEQGDYELELLPALPSLWKSGKVCGLRARGGFEAELMWADSKLQAAVIRSTTGQHCRVRYGNRSLELSLHPGETKIFHLQDFL